jgi:hypothetical protein
MSNTNSILTTKRFVIRKSLVGKNQIIEFKNQDKFESMNCFKKYKNYTNTNNLPKFVRELPKLV